RRDVRGPRGPHDRVDGGGRGPRPGPAGLPRGARPPMRVLHPGDDHDRPRAARREPRSQRGRDPNRDLGRDLPLYRLREHRPGDSMGRRPRARRSRKELKMATTTTASPETPIGYGRMKRKEDARFIRGQGKYLDDIVLPGMLHGAVLRSP